MIELAKPSREEWLLYAEAQSATELRQFQDLLAKNLPLLDDDGYPTEYALEVIEKWHWSLDSKEWLRFIEGIWHLKSFGWGSEVEGDATYYYISTAGWSGNESIIRAMENNNMLWSEHWVESRRGGHYIFEVKNI